MSVPPAAAAAAVGLSWAHVGAPSSQHGNRRRLVIFASKLAGCADMHPYMNRQEMRDEFQSRVYGIQSEGYEAPKEFEERALKELDGEAQALLQETLKQIETLPAADTAGAVAAAAKQIDAMSTLSDAVKGVVRTKMYTQHGVQGESAIRDETSKENKREIHADNKFRTKRIPVDVPGFDVFIGGRHDGISTLDSGEECVTEIKNRVRRHLGAPTYEKVQLHAYMDILSCRRGVIVENFKGSRKEHEFEFEQEFWDGVVAATGEFLLAAAVDT